MRDSILRRIYRRVQISRSEGIVLDAILSKANMFGKHARVAYECLAGITGFSVRHIIRLVKSLIYGVPGAMSAKFTVSSKWLRSSDRPLGSHETPEKLAANPNRG
jgi:hypothetical protein